MRDGCSMAERGVWFAGEHTAPVTEMGTVTGAYLAGEAIARRLVDMLTSGSRTCCSSAEK
jgi:hypothetical protein